MGLGVWFLGVASTVALLDFLHASLEYIVLFSRPHRCFTRRIPLLLKVVLESHLPDVALDPTLTRAMFTKELIFFFFSKMQSFFIIDINHVKIKML